MNRNLALAMLLAATFFTHPSTFAAVLAYGLLMLIVAFAIAAWFRRSTPALGRAVLGEAPIDDAERIAGDR